MSKIATLEIDGNKFELPIVIGSENEAAVDISKLRDQSGVITLDPGYKNSGSCKSEITFLDGELGILRYRGYAIEDLAEKAHFLEVSYLVIFGELPTASQLLQYETDIRKYTLVNEVMTAPTAVISPEDSMGVVMNKFESANKAFLPVLKNDKYYGFISKSVALEAYRSKLKSMTIE